ncbi:Na/Pi-cotransporter II-like protein [Cupriavidus basilensis OR16]|uniref:Na/Pi-cotransporter II-like protein n=1 Tax=Cupriavidus basilensis OR16 TaxID=1127483 RepID=H1SB58_9BURK|nr:Na/Pi symporter [Cupriavidus basilensis]EHP40296.1 Na/Pi-cotransporter II-like protein [Cupriavidus basilensis OR16]
MTFSYTLIDLAGFVALLLLGTQMFQTGIQRAFGAGLRSILGGTLRGRLRAFFGGMGVTAVLQSSTATGLITAGFAAEGLVGLVPALAVMLGANIGATLLVQVLSFEVATVSPALILVGVLMFRKASNARAHDLGRMLIGLGLMLLALHQLLELMTDYEDAPNLRMLLGAASTVPLVDVLLAAGLTWAANSNVAIVLLVTALCAQNVVPPNTAFALVLGANLGTAINPVLQATAPNDLVSKRLAVGNLLTRAVGVVVALAVLRPFGSFMVTIEPDNARVVADFHTLFNLVLAGLFLPLLSPFASLLTRLLPPLVEAADPSRPFRHDPVARQIPFGNMAREAHRLTDVLGQMLPGTRAAPIERGRKRIAEVRQRDDILDSLYGATKTHLTPLDPGPLGENDHLRFPEREYATHGEQRDGLEIREHRGHTLELLSADGKTQAYYPAKSLWLTLQDLQVVQQLESAGGDAQSTLSTYIHGTASFDDCRLSIIGESESSTRTVQISFAAREVSTADGKGLREWQEELGIALSDVPLGAARLGYNRSDHEMQEPEQWWASCLVPESSLQALSEGVADGRLTAVKVGLCLRGVYISEEQAVADFSGESCVCLRPGKSDNAMESPEIADGYVVHLSLDLTKVSLRGLEQSESAHDGLVLQEQINPTEADAVSVLVEKLGKLVASLKWLAALVALLVVVFAFKNR